MELKNIKMTNGKIILEDGSAISIVDTNTARTIDEGKLAIVRQPGIHYLGTIELVDTSDVHLPYLVIPLNYNTLSTEVSIWNAVNSVYVIKDSVELIKEMIPEWFI